LKAIDTCIIIELSKKPELVEPFCKWAESQKDGFVVCTQVVRECKREKTIAMLDHLKARIAVAEVPDLDGWVEFGSSMTLGDGELSTIYYCRQKKATVVTFDKKAIRTCQILKIEVVDFEEKFVRK